MKKTAIAIALAAMSATAIPAYAEIEVSGNFGLFSDYRFRGISQTDKKPALQGGFDVSLPAGFYIGTWGSNVADWANTGGNGMEIDVYGGYSQEISGVTLDVGLLRYMYPGSTAAQYTTEWYLGASYNVLSYKFSRSTTDNFFGIPNSKGSTYHAVSAEVPVNDQVNIYAHYGNSKVKGTGNPKFSDYKVGLSYSLPGDYSLALDYIGTSGLDQNEKTTFYTSGTKQLYKSAVVISVSKSF